VTGNTFFDFLNLVDLTIFSQAIARFNKTGVGKTY